MTNSDLLTDEEVQRRTAIAKMRSLELSVEKDALDLEEKKRNICRIDTALNEFDTLLVEFVAMIRGIPDRVQSVCPALKPKQYKALSAFIDEQLQRLSEKRLHLTIESTDEQRKAATAIKNESIQKAAKIKKAKK